MDEVEQVSSNGKNNIGGGLRENRLGAVLSLVGHRSMCTERESMVRRLVRLLILMRIAGDINPRVQICIEGKHYCQEQSE